MKRSIRKALMSLSGHKDCGFGRNRWDDGEPVEGICLKAAARRAKLKMRREAKAMTLAGAQS